MMRRFAYLSIITVALLMQTAQAEENLKDPTQAPASLNGNAANVQEPTGPVLQSVMLGAQYRAAIINGQKVLLGKKYEEATLIKLNEHEAVLRNKDGTTQTLVLGYGIEKKVLYPLTPHTSNKKKRSTKIE
ncbi:hypothetical protein GALL_169350 [mine drainage metagenome]|uniref:MSHA biogenesis protein MshK n=1 Tax=mine drainage metagenome TaxID=410659 RepID=A0A1J5RZ32_9ZZZZ